MRDAIENLLGALTGECEYRERCCVCGMLMLTSTACRTGDGPAHLYHDAPVLLYHCLEHHYSGSDEYVLLAGVPVGKVTWRAADGTAYVLDQQATVTAKTCTDVLLTLFGYERPGVAA